MKVITYMCENCFEPHIFNPNDKNTEFLCPKCGEKMMYFCTEYIDPTINKVINRYDEEERKLNHSGKQCLTKPQPKCPTCQSTNIKKMGGIERGVSIYAFGLFSKKINKTFKCKNCGYTW